MQVKHLFESPAADLGNPDEISPSDWNDDHVVNAIWAAVHHTTTQTVATSTTTPLLFNSERSDLFGFHSTASDTNRLTVPAGLAGVYLVKATCFWDSNTSGARILSIRLNGADVSGEPPARSGTSASGLNQEKIAIVSLAVGDWVEAAVWQNSGSTRTVGSTNSWEWHGFSLIRLGS